MSLVRGSGRGKGRVGIVKPKNRGPTVKPPPLLGRPAPPPSMALRPRCLPVPPLIPRMRAPPPAPPELRPLRALPNVPPPMLGPGRPVPPPFHTTPPPHPHVFSLPPPMPLRPSVPPPSLLRARGPLPGHGAVYGPPVPQRGKFGGRRGGNFAKGGQRRGKKNDYAEGAYATDETHYCETCDRSFRSEVMLKEHVSEHQTCGLDGCQFTAHSTVVMRHVQMQHATGLYNKISAVTDKPEDIAKWIAERKKRYPTRENIEKQKKEHDEKMKRGERLEDDKSRFNRDFSVRRGRNHGSRGALRGRGKRFPSRTANDVCNKPARTKHPFSRRTRAQTTSGSALLSDDEEHTNCRGKLPAFLGTVAFSHENEESESEEEDEKKFSDTEWNLNQEHKPDTNNVCGSIVSVSKALSNIIGLYASDASDSEEEECLSMNKTANLQVTKATETAAKSDVPNQSSVKTVSLSGVSTTHDSDDSGPEVVPIVKSLKDIPSTDEKQENERQMQAPVHKRKRVHRHKSNKRKLEGSDETESSAAKMQKPVQAPRKKTLPLRQRRRTLLEKLLSSEIRHERNAILQCIRYVVNENFFDTGSGTQKLQQKAEGSEEAVLDKQCTSERILSKMGILRQCNHYVVENKFFGIPCSEGNNCDEDND